MVKARWASIILLAVSLGAAAVPAPTNKPVTRDDILLMLNNYVPSPNVTTIVKANGVDFDPDPDYLKKVRAAGGKDDLLAALREAHGSAAQHTTVQRPASDLEVDQHFSRALELEKLESYPEAERNTAPRSPFSRKTAFYTSVWGGHSPSRRSGMMRWRSIVRRSASIRNLRRLTPL